MSERTIKQKLSQPVVIKGPQPERLKIKGYRNWENAVAAAMRKPKPAKGWPK